MKEEEVEDPVLKKREGGGGSEMKNSMIGAYDGSGGREEVSL